MAFRRKARLEKEAKEAAEKAAAEVVVYGPELDWHCHCCGKRNNRGLDKCSCCGRPDSYAMSNYPLPLHGDMGLLFRPEQVASLMREDVDMLDDLGWTALHQACSRGNLLHVKELLKLGAYVEAKTGKGQTPLHLAVFSGSLPTVQAIVEAGAVLDKPRDSDLYTALHIACEGNWKDIAIYLIQRGCDINPEDLTMRTPLHLVACLPGDRVDLAAYMLKKGAREGALDAHGWCPRQLAELYSNRNIQEIIVRMNLKDAIATLVDLPKADWHNDLWNEVVGGYQAIREEALQDKLREERMKEQVRQLHAQWNEETRLRKQREAVEAAEKKERARARAQSMFAMTDFGSLNALKTAEGASPGSSRGASKLQLSIPEPYADDFGFHNYQSKVASITSLNLSSKLSRQVSGSISQKRQTFAVASPAASGSSSPAGPRFRLPKRYSAEEVRAGIGRAVARVSSDGGEAAPDPAPGGSSAGDDGGSASYTEVAEVYLKQPLPLDVGEKVRLNLARGVQIEDNHNHYHKPLPALRQGALVRVGLLPAMARRASLGV